MIQKFFLYLALILFAFSPLQAGKNGKDKAGSPENKTLTEDEKRKKN